MRARVRVRQVKRVRGYQATICMRSMRVMGVKHSPYLRGGKEGRITIGTWTGMGTSRTRGHPSHMAGTGRRKKEVVVEG